MFIDWMRYIDRSQKSSSIKCIKNDLMRSYLFSYQTVLQLLHLFSWEISPGWVARPSPFWPRAWSMAWKPELDHIYSILFLCFHHLSLKGVAELRARKSGFWGHPWRMLWWRRQNLSGESKMCCTANIAAQRICHFYRFCQLLCRKVWLALLIVGTVKAKPFQTLWLHPGPPWVLMANIFTPVKVSANHER